jgi:putative aldouronate transport system permease protein
MMVVDRSFGSRVFDAVNFVILVLVGLSCLLPIVHLAAISLSESSAVGGGLVSLWPVRFTLASYVRITEDSAFFRASLVSILRTSVGTTLNMIVTILLAYPLAQSRSRLRYRNVLAALVVIPMYFHAGLIPTYMVVRAVGLLNSFWALILPTMVPVWSVIILMNFFRTQPRELEEAAIVDGANPVQILVRIAVPIARPALATIGLFAILKHWNSFFDGLIYLNSPRDYPLQTYLYGQVVSAASLIELLQEGAENLALYFNTETIRAAQIFLATIPIIIIYPLLQKHFVKGIVLGSVKG